MVHDQRFEELLGAGAPLIATIFDAIPFGLGVAWPVTDATGALVDFESGYTNPAAERMLSVPLASQVGTRLREAIPGFVELGLYDRLARVLASGKPESGELAVDTMWRGAIHVRGVWVHNALPFGSGVLSATADVTDERRREAELRDFAAVAAHDLREPLISIQLMAGLLSRRDMLGTTEQEMAASLRDGAERARGLVDGILEYATAGGNDASSDAVDCHHVVGEVLAALESQIEQVSGRVEVGPLPMVPASRTGLRRVFQNLIANALKFHDGPAPLVTISATEDDAAWTFAVRDNGIGLPDESAIFEMFTRGTTGHDGSGIGLATCRRIIEGYGGRIWAESNAGAGSTFMFTLPATA
jgi:signal transduction histidine kinase